MICERRGHHGHICAHSVVFTNRSRTLLFYSDAFGVAAAISMCTLLIYTLFLRNCKSDWHPRHTYLFAVQLANTCCSTRNRCSATGVLLRTGHGTAVTGRLVQVAGESVAGKFHSRHIECTVLLRGFAIPEEIYETRLKQLCFFCRSSGACLASIWGSASSRR